MNRADRRKKGIKQPRPQMTHIKTEDYNKAITNAYAKGVQDAYDKASQLSVFFMMTIPLLVLNEKFNEIRLKEFKGVSRIEHFFELCMEKFDEYNDGQDTLARLLKDVKEQTGFDVESKVIVKDDTKGKIPFS